MGSSPFSFLFLYSVRAALAVDAARGWLFMSGGGWIQSARLDGSRRRLLHNGTAVADIALDVEVTRTEGRLSWWRDVQASLG